MYSNDFLLEFGRLYSFLLILNQTPGLETITFQLASPVASDRFDPLAKTNFLLAREPLQTHHKCVNTRS